MDSFVYSLAVPALGGMAFLAYRHPQAYKKLSCLITALFAATVAALNAWNLAVSKSWNWVFNYIPSGNVETALKAMKEAEFSSFQTFVLPLMFLGFHIFLLALPNLIREKHG